VVGVEEHEVRGYPNRRSVSYESPQQVPLTTNALQISTDCQIFYLLKKNVLLCVRKFLLLLACLWTRQTSVDATVSVLRVKLKTCAVLYKDSYWPLLILLRALVTQDSNSTVVVVFLRTIVELF
jgi:hypothetical protein